MIVRLIPFVAALLMLAAIADAPSVGADAESLDHHAQVEAVSFDGQGTVGEPVTRAESDFEVFSEGVESFDDPNQGRSADAEAFQDTTVDFSDPHDASADTSGTAWAIWTDGEAGDGADPSASARSEFEITFQVTDHPMPFSLVGSIEATADPIVDGCTFVEVTVPNGETFEVGAPSGCGKTTMDIETAGTLDEGKHTFSVVASASAANGDALGGEAMAEFNLSLNLSCTVDVESGDPEDDTDEDNIPNGVEESIGTSPYCEDTDGDGLLDPWEVPEDTEGAGFDLHDDGDIDATRDDVFGPYRGECPDDLDPELRRQPWSPYCELVGVPDPLHKDVYLEMDWQDCFLGSCPELVGLTADPSHHAPSIEGLEDVIAAFAAAPVKNPDDTNGINLHILVDEGIPHTPNCDKGGATTRSSNFGTVEQRQTPIVVTAKGEVYRYAWSGHSSILDNTGGSCPLPASWEILASGAGIHPLPFYDISPHGDAIPGGRDIIVTLAVTWVCQLYTFDVDAPLDTVPPCFRKFPAPVPPVALAPGLFPADIFLQNGGETHVEKPVFMTLGLQPSQGVRQVWSRTMMNLLGYSLGVPSASVGNSPNATGLHPPESYGSWKGLLYAPPANNPPRLRGAGGAGDGGFVPILPDFSLAEQDQDGDGVIERDDNCPGFDNPAQADLDGDGSGDDCDLDVDGDGIPVPDDGDPRDTDNDGTENEADGDDDQDGVLDAGDNCVLFANGGQENMDGDGEGDLCDADADDDGFPNVLELIAGSDHQSEDRGPEYLGNGDTCGDGLDNDADGDTDATDDGCIDADGDTVPTVADNCPATDGLNLLDSDGDGKGDICDAGQLSGDVNCSGAVDSVDGLGISRYVAGLAVGQTEPCDDLGSGAPNVVGDVNCDDQVTAVDSLFVLRHVAGLPVNLPNGCREIGT